MSLYVDPAGLTSLERMVRRGGEDATEALSHFQKHSDIAWLNEGIINVLQGDVSRVQQDVLAYLDMAGHTVLPATANAIAHSRDYYTHTDQANAEKVDATMPGANPAADGAGVPGPTPGPSNRDLVRFKDVHEPTRHLGDVPYDYSAYNEDQQPQWWNMISPSAQLRNAIQLLTGHDPYEVILKPICGDWAGMARVGHVVDQLARCLRDISYNQHWAAQSLTPVWTGNAADAASAYLYRLTKSLQAAADTLEEIGNMYRVTSKGAFDLANVIGSLLDEITDAAIAAAAAGWIAGGAASTGVGLPVAALAGLVGAIEVSRVISTVLAIIDYVGRYQSLASFMSSSLARYGRVDSDYPMPRLPGLPEMPR